jgi:hypothetical protein
MSSSAKPQGSFITLWAGEDPALHSALIEELQAADIPFLDKPIGRDEVAPTADTLPIDWKPRFGFEVVVSSTDLPAAQELLDKLLDEEPLDMELPASDAAPPTAAAPASLSKATSAVWSGDDQERADFLSQALKENEIPVRIEKQATGTTLLVPPEEETLAREILREILEGQPPA